MGISYVCNYGSGTVMFLVKSENTILVMDNNEGITYKLKRVVDADDE
jgi:hypothetical protein